jgi:hypothetical protein
LSTRWGRPGSMRTRPTSPSPPIAANASDIALAPHRCERVGCRLRLPSVRTRPTTPSTPIGTKPDGLVYPSPRLSLRSWGYLGFRTQPPLNPEGVVYAVTCGFAPLPAPRLTRIGLRRSAPNQSLFVRTYLLLVFRPNHHKPVRSTPRFVPRIDPSTRQPHSDHVARSGLTNRLHHYTKQLFGNYLWHNLSHESPHPGRFQPTSLHPKKIPALPKNRLALPMRYP